MTFTFAKFLAATTTLAGAVAGTSVVRQSQWPAIDANAHHDSSWSGFHNETLRWTTFSAPTFNQVFIPTCEEELAEGVKYLAANNIPFLTKSGGHGYSTTLRLIQDGTLINMQNFNYSKMNDDGTIRFGSGVVFEDMEVAVSDAGRELNLGSCPCVGGIGAMLGGGLGRLQGKHGLTSDAVRSIRMVLWNGTIIETSETQYPDLYWGMRGAGQNFGVVIEATFQTWPITNDGMVYQADMTFTLDNLTNLISTVNAVIPLPEALALAVTIASNPKTLDPIVFLNLVYFGPQTEGQVYTQKFAPFSSTHNETILTAHDLLLKGAEGFPLAKCIKGQGHVMYGAITETVDPPSYKDMVNSYIDFVKQYPSANESSLILETFAQQGINALPADYSAFPHRGTFNNEVEIEIASDDPVILEAGNKWARGWRDHFASPEISNYCPIPTYQNYAHGDEPLPQLYGTEQWRQERLTALKNEYDPHGVFNAFHAIPTSLADWEKPGLGSD